MSNRHITYDVKAKIHTKKKKKTKQKIHYSFYNVKKNDNIVLINHWYKKTKIKKGSKGKVLFVDSLMSVLVLWDNGEKFWLLPKHDKFKIIKNKND